MSTFGERLKFYIDIITGLSRNKIAEMLDTSKQNISNYVNDLSLPNKEVMVKLRDVLGVSIDWLYSGDGNIFLNNEAGDFFRERYEWIEKSKNYNKKDAEEKRVTREGNEPDPEYATKKELEDFEKKVLGRLEAMIEEKYLGTAAADGKKLKEEVEKQKKKK